MGRHADRLQSAILESGKTRALIDAEVAKVIRELNAQREWTNKVHREWIDWGSDDLVGGPGFDFPGFVNRHSGPLTFGLFLIGMAVSCMVRFPQGSLLLGIGLCAALWGVFAYIRENPASDDAIDAQRAAERQRLIADCDSQNAALGRGDWERGTYGRFPPTASGPIMPQPGHVHDGFHCARGCLS